jgi:hypothetical protein
MLLRYLIQPWPLVQQGRRAADLAGRRQRHAVILTCSLLHKPGCSAGRSARRFLTGSVAT